MVFAQNGVQFIRQRYDMTEQQAAFLMSLPYTISAVLCPIFGYLVDTTGRALVWVFLSTTLLGITHFSFAFIPKFPAWGAFTTSCTLPHPTFVCIPSYLTSTSCIPSYLTSTSCNYAGLALLALHAHSIGRVEPLLSPGYISSMSSFLIPSSALRSRGLFYGHFLLCVCRCTLALYSYCRGNPQTRDRIWPDDRLPKL